MADQAPSFQFEDIPIEEARKIGRGPRMDPEIYHALKENIQSLDNTASRMSLPDGTSPTTMKNRILRVAAELGVPVTVRKVPVASSSGGSSEEDMQQAHEVASRLQTGRRRPHSPQRAPAEGTR